MSMSISKSSSGGSSTLKREGDFRVFQASYLHFQMKLLSFTDKICKSLKHKKTKSAQDFSAGRTIPYLLSVNGARLLVQASALSSVMVPDE